MLCNYYEAHPGRFIIKFSNRVKLCLKASTNFENFVQVITFVIKSNAFSRHLPSVNFCDHILLHVTIYEIMSGYQLLEI